MRRHVTAIGLAVSGLAFIGYPALRPWGPETGAEGADTFGSLAWPVSHALGMLGFVALAFALRAATVSATWRWSGGPIRRTEGLMWLAVAMLLPYYGAEAYGLQALGQYVGEHGEVGALAIADSFRYAPLPMTTFGLGLLALVVVGVDLARGLWRTGSLGRTGGLLAGLGLATYLPQFLGGAELRIAHGVLLGVGLLLVARSAMKHPESRSVERPAPATSTAAPAA